MIPSTICLSCVIYYFAGGSPYNIAIAHGISVREVYTSVRRTVDAVNKTQALKRSSSSNSMDSNQHGKSSGMWVFIGQLTHCSSSSSSMNSDEQNSSMGDGYAIKVV